MYVCTCMYICMYVCSYICMYAVRCAPPHWLTSIILYSIVVNLTTCNCNTQYIPVCMSVPAVANAHAPAKSALVVARAAVERVRIRVLRVVFVVLLRRVENLLADRPVVMQRRGTRTRTRCRLALVARRRRSSRTRAALGIRPMRQHSTQLNSKFASDLQCK